MTTTSLGFKLETSFIPPPEPPAVPVELISGCEQNHVSLKRIAIELIDNGSWKAINKMYMLKSGLDVRPVATPDTLATWITLCALHNQESTGGVKYRARFVLHCEGGKDREKSAGYVTFNIDPRPQAATPQDRDSTNMIAFLQQELAQARSQLERRDAERQLHYDRILETNQRLIEQLLSTFDTFAKVGTRALEIHGKLNSAESLQSTVELTSEMWRQIHVDRANLAEEQALRRYDTRELEVTAREQELSVRKQELSIQEKSASKQKLLDLIAKLVHVADINPVELLTDFLSNGKRSSKSSGQEQGSANNKSNTTRPSQEPPNTSATADADPQADVGSGFETVENPTSPPQQPQSTPPSTEATAEPPSDGQTPSPGRLMYGDQLMEAITVFFQSLDESDQDVLDSLVPRETLQKLCALSRASLDEALRLIASIEQDLTRDLRIVLELQKRLDKTSLELLQIVRRCAALIHSTDEREGRCSI